MDRTELVHMVALVRPRPCIHEGELASDKECRLVVRDGEGSCEDSTRLAVLSMAVAKEEGVRC